MKRLRLRELRELRALSQAELAERAGIGKATVSRLEKANHPPPRPRTVRKLAAALGVEPADLYVSDPREDDAS